MRQSLERWHDLFRQRRYCVYQSAYRGRTWWKLYAPHNFLREENLDYLVEAVETEMFGEPLYPTLIDKAAVYCYNIIDNHIFSDGNKRTGLEASLAFLKLNGKRLNRSLPPDDLYNFILKVASGQSSLDECRSWFDEYTIPYP